jgi:TRAP-type uncharacterized transport system substrate-binding protein
MTNITQPIPVRFSASWSTQLRLTQAIGRGLADLVPISATIVIGGRGDAGLESGDVDLLFQKSVVNEHRYWGKGLYAGKAPASWLRTIAWLPQDDRMLFAVGPSAGITSFEDIAAKKPKLNIAGGAAGPALRAYGFSYDDVKAWGGTVTPMEHTAKAAKERYDAGMLDACFGDGSAYDGTCWKWMAERGYRFLDISEAAMQKLEAQGLRRHITPAGFLPGISQTLLALDDSDIVLTCNERLADEVAYALAKAIDTRATEIECESMQVAYGEPGPLPLTQPTMWTSLTGHIERQWDQRILGAPLHAGAERYYREKGVLNRV